MYDDKFQRVEEKYLLTKKEKSSFLKMAKSHLEKDKYFYSKIHNIYFDTKNNDLIIYSLEKPVFKDKFRIRSYNKPTLEDNIFFEMKTKYKGIVVVTLLTIESGTFNLNTYDDSLHSNGNITINFGEYYISSGDDGIHADNTLTINNGTIEVTKTYEGVEDETIVINAGTINLVASDDGINADGGADSSANNHPNHQETYSKSSLTINGGTIIVSGQQVMVMEP